MTGRLLPSVLRKSPMRANARVWGVQSPSSSREDHFSKIGKVWSPGESCAKQVIRPLWENLALIGIYTPGADPHSHHYFPVGCR